MLFLISGILKKQTACPEEPTSRLFLLYDNGASYQPNERVIERHHQGVLLNVCCVFILLLKYINPN